MASGRFFETRKINPAPFPMPPRQALLLTAGLATRLRPLTLVRAKPAVPVAGEALIQRIIRWLVGRGITDLVLNLHHLPDTLTAIVGDGSDLGARVRYSWEQPQVLGSAGGPRRALPLIDSDPFFIVNGDTLTDVDLAGLADAHATSAPLVTLALVPNREPHKYGGVRLEGSRVTGFVRRGASAAGSYHFVGVQIAQSDAFRALAPDRAMSSIGEVYDELLARRPGSIRGFVTDASFWDVGTLSDYWRTSIAFMDPGGQAQWRGLRARIGPRARVMRSILWDDVEIGAGAAIEECIVADRTRVPDGAAYRRSALVQTDAGLIVAPFD
jgi:NDP-sugar pyrophosphorylase family protein